MVIYTYSLDETAYKLTSVDTRQADGLHNPLLGYRCDMIHLFELHLRRYSGGVNK